jgi:uncharacterized repeat protein (TIGR01451 family)
MRTLRGVLYLLGAISLCWARIAWADTTTQTSNFTFNHSSAVSSGAVSVAATYSQTDTASPSALTFTQFNTSLGRLSQVTVSVTTSTATFNVSASGVVSLISTASATRKLEYLVTAGATTGGDSNQLTTSGTGLVVLIGSGPTNIGGAPLATSTLFSSSTDLARFTGSGTVSVGITATDTLSVTTLVSLFNGAGFSGTGTYAGSVSVTYTYTPWPLTGSIYNDADHSGFKDAAETGTGLTLYAKLLNETSPGGPALQAVAVNPASGAFLFGVSRGTYRIVIDDNATLSDVVPLVTPSDWTATQASSGIRSNIVVAADLGGQDFGLIHATTACGRTFRDDGSGSGTANDGVLNGTEGGLGGQVLRLLDAGNAVLDSVTPGTDGSYCLYIPFTVANGASLRAARTVGSFFLATSASAGNTGGSYSRATDMLTFSNVTSVKYTGLNFGSVPVPAFEGSADQSGTPSSVLWFAHRFTAGSAGQVTFTASYVASPNSPPFTETIYQDSNGNGKIDAGEPLVTGPLSVAAGSVINLLVKVTIPAMAPPGANAQVSLRADMTFSNASPSLSYSLTVLDKLGVMSSVTTGAVQLIKSVDKALAPPGATLVYTIAFTNLGATPVQQLTINDSTPSYTTFLATSAVSLPAALGTMTTTAPSVGVTGTLRWSFAGQLTPGATGSIQFSVMLAP